MHRRAALADGSPRLAVGRRGFQWVDLAPGQLLDERPRLGELRAGGSGAVPVDDVGVGALHVAPHGRRGATGVVGTQGPGVEGGEQVVDRRLVADPAVPLRAGPRMGWLAHHAHGARLFGLQRGQAQVVALQGGEWSMGQVGAPHTEPVPALGAAERLGQHRLERRLDLDQDRGAVGDAPGDERRHDGHELFRRGVEGRFVTERLGVRGSVDGIGLAHRRVLRTASLTPCTPAGLPHGTGFSNAPCAATYVVGRSHGRPPGRADGGGRRWAGSTDVR